MPETPGFWDIGPHDHLPVEATWQRFVRTAGGSVVADLLPGDPGFENADFFFESEGVVGELKEIQTEFMATAASRRGLDNLMSRLVAEDPSWRPMSFGGDGRYPTWFTREFIRLARPPIARVLKKANVQIRETKAHFNITGATGVLLFVNDGFTGLGPDLVHDLASDLLVHSYSSIDCFVYLTVNRYVEIPGSNEPKLLWHPTYSTRASDSLVGFVDQLGRRWFDFLKQEIGPFTSRTTTDERDLLRGSRHVVVPGQESGS
jgi:hypothetical protein